MMNKHQSYGPTTALLNHDDLVLEQDEDWDSKSRRRRHRMDDERVLEPWERYRVLSDHNDGLFDLTELIDRKTRFALMILGGLNAINLVIVTRADVFGLSLGAAPFIRVYGGCYLVLSLYFFIYAISALRPRSRELTKQRSGLPSDYVRGLRISDRIVAQTPEAYYQEWLTARIGELNCEMSLIAHGMARTTTVKLDALHRVFTGLTILVVLTGVFVIFSVGMYLA